MTRFRRAVFGLGLAAMLTLPGCLQPPSPAQQLTEAARELNLASRFGRMDVAIEKTGSGMRKSFVKRRKDWGRSIRVLDVELAGMQLKDKDNATIYVDVSWMNMGQGVLQTTRVEQGWKNKIKGGWQLVREKRNGGAYGLFGEKVDVAAPEPRGDVHFPSVTIR